MKSKIAIKLAVSFFAVLLIFSLSVGFVFTTLFRNQIVALNKEEFLQKAHTLAKVLTTNSMELSSSPGHGMNKAGRENFYGLYLRLFTNLNQANAWVVDEDLQIITDFSGQGKRVNYADLPMDAETVVKEVFLGNDTFSEGFSILLEAPTLTVGYPLIANQKIIGALLLHTPMKGLNEPIQQGSRILWMSLVVALLLSVGFSVFLAITLTKPLKKMQNTALQLAQGEYNVKTGIQANDEIGELADSLDILSQRLWEANQESEKLNQLRKDFVANISHELRTPVTVIRGSLEALCDGVVTSPEKVSEYHRQMLEESVFLQRLVDDLLDLSKLQNSDFKVETEQVNLCDVLQDICRSSRPLAQPKALQIELSMDREVFAFSGDYGRLRQMFMIVLENAIKFSPLKATVKISMIKNKVCFSDQGRGIPLQEIPLIFERFYQVKSEENTAGSGLGLAIAKQIAERHDVVIEVNSQEQQGSNFCFVFPQEGIYKMRVRQ